jgi:hypothetical protein
LWLGIIKNPHNKVKVIGHYRDRKQRPTTMRCCFPELTNQFLGVGLN